MSGGAASDKTSAGAFLKRAMIAGSISTTLILVIILIICVLYCPKDGPASAKHLVTILVGIYGLFGLAAGFVANEWRIKLYDARVVWLAEICFLVPVVSSAIASALMVGFVALAYLVVSFLVSAVLGVGIAICSER